MSSILKKWWVLLLQGILLIILGIVVFSNPAEVLAGISLWFGIIILFTGAAGVISWLFGGKENREHVSMLWSLFSVLMGIFILMNLLVAMKAVTMVFGFWVLMTGMSLLSSGWGIKRETALGWVLVVIGILSGIAGLYMIFNIFSGAEGVSIILGLQCLLGGIGFIILALVKKMVTGKVREKLESAINQ